MMINKYSKILIQIQFLCEVQQCYRFEENFDLFVPTNMANSIKKCMSEFKLFPIKLFENQCIGIYSFLETYSSTRHDEFDNVFSLEI